MKIRVLGFATAAEALGAGELEVELPEGADLELLREALIARHPGLETLWPRLAVAVNGELGKAEEVLEEGAEVALLPPVSGGQPDLDGLVDEPIDPQEVLSRIDDPSCGAQLLFLGVVRNHHKGRPVEGITYHGYRPMAEKALKKIARELEEGHPGARVVLVHRLGDLAVGEASTAIAVGSAHREEAYELSRLALERLKAEVPIWKLERYPDGTSLWREEEPLGAAGA
jgi:molybdopterin synthase catalytic subunit/molybdopterin converting factor small subunit